MGVDFGDLRMRAYLWRNFIYFFA